jgi:hypothetical protein
MTFEEKVYKDAVKMLEENGGFAFSKKKYYSREELLPQQHFISREMFFYQLTIYLMKFILISKKFIILI